MKLETYIDTQSRVKELTFLHITHNLKTTRKFLTHLLEFLENEIDAGKMLQQDSEIIRNLCNANSKSIEKIQQILFEEVGQETTQTEKNLPENFPDIRAEDRDLEQAFRENVVYLMILAVQSWEQATQKSKIELAEESRIWRVNIDDGRLRVRSMDRYLDMHKLPRIPRWRCVVRTAYFVLDRINQESPMRRRLELSLERTLQIIRMRSSQGFS